jgi:transposase-like protein
MRCFRSFHTAERTIEGIAAAHMVRKGQIKRLDGRAYSWRRATSGLVRAARRAGM